MFLLALVCVSVGDHDKEKGTWWTVVVFVPNFMVRFLAGNVSVLCARLKLAFLSPFECMYIIVSYFVLYRVCRVDRERLCSWLHSCAVRSD